MSDLQDSRLIIAERKKGAPVYDKVYTFQNPEGFINSIRKGFIRSGRFGLDEIETIDDAKRAIEQAEAREVWVIDKFEFDKYDLSSFPPSILSFALYFRWYKDLVFKK